MHGRETVADLLITVAANVPAGSTVAYRNINGDPSAVLLTGDAPFAVMVLDLDGPHGTGVYSITKPDKLTRI